MGLTTQQRQTLKTAITAEPTLATAIAQGDDQAIADWLNAATAFVVWRTSVAVDEIMANGFVWTEIDALGNGKARIWEWMSRLGTINPSKANVRQGLRDCFETAAPGTFGNRTTGVGGLQPHLRRTASRAEQLLASGTGTTANPGSLAAEGVITPADASLVRTA